MSLVTGSDDESVDESEDDSDFDESDEESMSDAGGYDLDVCPPGCDQVISLFSLRVLSLD